MLTLDDEDALVFGNIKVVDWDKSEPYTTGWTPDHLGKSIDGKKPSRTLCGVRMKGKIQVFEKIRNGLCTRCAKSAAKIKKNEKL